MKSLLLMTSLFLIQLDNTDTIRKEKSRVPDPVSAESQFRMLAYLSQFIKTCDAYVQINHVTSEMALVTLKTNAVSLKGTAPAHELYEEAVKIEDEIRLFSIKLLGTKVWCDLNKFVLTGHGYGQIFKTEEQK